MTPQTIKLLDRWNRLDLKNGYMNVLSFIYRT